MSWKGKCEGECWCKCCKPPADQSAEELDAMEDQEEPQEGEPLMRPLTGFDLFVMQKYSQQ